MVMMAMTTTTATMLMRWYACICIHVIGHRAAELSRAQSHGCQHHQVHTFASVIYPAHRDIEYEYIGMSAQLLRIPSIVGESKVLDASEDENDSLTGGYAIRYTPRISYIQKI